MSKYIKRLKEKYKETKKSSLLVYFILRALILLCMVLQIIHGDWNNAALCLLSLILFTVPTFIEYKFWYYRHNERFDRKFCGISYI